jgi:hypothetical protein
MQRFNMDDDDFLALRDRLNGLRAKHRKSSSKEYPPSAKLLEGMLLDLDPLNNDAIILRGLLAEEYCLHGLIEKEEELKRFETKNFPDEPVPWISLAEFLHHSKEDFEEALPTGKIDEDILARYNALKSGKAGPFRWPGPGSD